MFPLNKSIGKKQYFDYKAEESKQMKAVLVDPCSQKYVFNEHQHRFKNRSKDVLLPPEKQKLYEEKLEKAYDKQELNRRMRSISPDNFFKFKDFYGGKADVVCENPNRCCPDLKEVYTQKCAGFESELTRKIKSKKLESPFEWKIDAKTPDRPFRDRYKLGHNKVSGKITVAAEENAFRALEAAAARQGLRYRPAPKTFRPRDALLAKSKSSSNFAAKPDIASMHFGNSKPGLALFISSPV